MLWARPVEPEFHARYSAIRRRYRYMLLNHPVRTGLDHRRVGWFHAPLDVSAMQAAATALLGEHDFSAFRSSECQARSPVRRLESLSITARGPYLQFDFCANGFLHHMVRNIMGCLVFVGKRRGDTAWIVQLLESRDRTRGAPMFEAAGLYFVGAEYDPVWGIPAAPRSGPVLTEDRMEPT